MFLSANNKRSAIQAHLANRLICSDIKSDPASFPRRRKNHPHTTQVPSHREARSAGEPKRRRERMERGPSVRADGAGPDRGPPKGHPAGVEDRGGYPGRSRDRVVARPARRRRCGKARTRPPDASFRKTSRAERSAFVETVFLSTHPGEGPGAPPSLPTPLAPSPAARRHRHARLAAEMSCQWTDRARDRMRLSALSCVVGGSSEFSACPTP